MPKLSNAQLLADRQHRAIEGLIGKARRALEQIRVAESAGEERLALILSHVSKAQAMGPSDDQLERLWALVEEGQRRLEQLVPSERVRYSEDSAESLDSKALGQGAVL